MKPLIVQKYGGATLADPLKIKSVAARIAEQSRTHSLIIVVSAMGSTTNSLIELANQVSVRPPRREMDMLLSVGERMSMSLMSMALNDLGCPAISFTGSQAGIFTDDSHVNAFIKDVRPVRVKEALDQNKIVILAGFQGVSPITKEITTLGRGGSDTSAVAMAAAFQAERCEILKDVPAVFSADPRIVNSAHPLSTLSYDQLMDMTFWGAKVLHYRSVELARLKSVPLYIGPAAEKTSTGTWIEKGSTMYESVKALSINSHDFVLSFIVNQKNSHAAIQELRQLLEEKQIAFPQLLQLNREDNHFRVLLTGPSEIIQATKRELERKPHFVLDSKEYATVTVTCTGATSPDLIEEMTGALQAQSLNALQLIVSAMSATVLVERNKKVDVVKCLHQTLFK